ncbi:MAG TPA: sigma-70 family RNA polymerase sigma factor [Actinomycetota bacterium]|nr:sigma-70 family RNA polymerase sigma factor [Actinomycetota bacterium]
MYGYLVRRVGPQVAEELAAEVFTQAFRQRGRFDPAREDAGPWLFGIAANLLRRHRREERRRLMAYARTGVDAVAHDETEEVDSRTDADAIGRQLALALATLRASEREVLLLFAWAELSYQEIAEALVNGQAKVSTGGQLKVSTLSLPSSLLLPSIGPPSSGRTRPR